jgi:hypothetical protein
MLSGALVLTAMAEGQYGKWTDENAIEWGHRYSNSKASRLLDDPIFAYGMGVGSNSVRRLYLNDFWKLREISARYNLPTEWVARSGAERASIAVSARNLYTLYRSQSHIFGGKISDPEYGRASTGTGDANYWEVPPIANISVTLRVTF